MPRKTSDPADCLERYGNFRPTPMDHSGAFLPDRADWFVGPVSHNRDSGLLDESNWDAAVKVMTEDCGPEGEDNGWEIHRFGHWGPGWFEIIIARPNSPAAVKLAELASALDGYPVLDDVDHSQREYDGAIENIESEGARYSDGSEGWAAEVFTWLWHNEQRECDAVDDGPAYPSREAIVRALIALDKLSTDADDARDGWIINGRSIARQFIARRKALLAGPRFNIDTQKWEPAEPANHVHDYFNSLLRKVQRWNWRQGIL